MVKMSFFDFLINPIKSVVRAIIYPFSVPIEILFSYPFPNVFPHHQIKQAKREGKTINHRLWIKEFDPYPIYLKKTNYRYRGVIGVDMERCTGCRRCERICPNKCIRMVPRSDEEILNRFPYININPVNKKKIYPEIYYGRCLYCGYCAEPLVLGCPFDALNLTNMFDLADVFDDNLILTPERLQLVVEKTGKGWRNYWTSPVGKSLDYKGWIGKFPPGN